MIVAVCFTECSSRSNHHGMLLRESGLCYGTTPTGPKHKIGHRGICITALMIVFICGYMYIYLLGYLLLESPAHLPPLDLSWTLMWIIIVRRVSESKERITKFNGPCSSRHRKLRSAPTTSHKHKQQERPPESLTSPLSSPGMRGKYVEVEESFWWRQ